MRSYLFINNTFPNVKLETLFPCGPQTKEGLDVPCCVHQTSWTIVFYFISLNVSYNRNNQVL